MKRALLPAVLAAAMSTVSAGQRPQPLNWTAQQDHQNMMEQLGIKALRPGPSGNENAPNQIGRAHV